MSSLRCVEESAGRPFALSSTFNNFQIFFCVSGSALLCTWVFASCDEIISCKASRCHESNPILEARVPTVKMSDGRVVKGECPFVFETFGIHLRFLCSNFHTFCP